MPLAGSNGCISRLTSYLERANMTDQKKSKEPYNGSTPHGVNVDRMASKAIERLELRFNSLKVLIKNLANEIASSEKDEKQRQEAYAKFLKSQKELDDILEIKSRIMAMNPVLDTEVGLDYKNFDSSVVDEYKF